MRNVIIKDTRIGTEEMFEFLEQYKTFWKEEADIEQVFWVEQRDFSSVPTTVDSDGDLKPTWKYRQDLAADVHKRYKDYGADNIVMLVHQDNFLFKGVWGVNWAYKHFKYCFQLVRWDKKNVNNTLGTMYHEQMHSVDSFIKEETGYDINHLFGGDWDKYVVHGGRPGEEGKYKWKYIKFKENKDALKSVSSNLKKALKVRKDKHNKVMIQLLNTAIRLLQTILMYKDDKPSHK